MFSHNYRSISAILTPGERRRSAMLMAMDIFVSIADILFLTLLLYIMKAYSGGAGGKVPGMTPIIVFFFLFSVKNLAGFLVYRQQCRHLYQIASRISGNKLLQYLEGGWEGYTRTDPSVQLREISYQPLEFCQHVLGGWQQIITQVVLIVLTIAAILFYNATLFLLLLVILLPPVILVFYLVKARSSSVGKKARAHSEKALQHLQEALSGYVESNIYEKNSFFLNKYSKEQDRFNRYIAGHSVVQGIPSRMIEVFALMGIVLLMVINRWTGNANSSSLITVGVFMAAAYKIIPGIVKILTLGGQINTYSFTIDRLGLTDRSSCSVADKAARRIRSIGFRDVCFSYGERPILDGEAFAAQTGDCIGIAGVSGRGKTTVLYLLLGFLQPQSGSISINGKSTTAEERRRYWRDIAYVKQQPFLIHDSILQNIVLGEDPYDERRLEEALSLSGLSAIADSFPGKWDTVISGNGRDISGGQRQRIAIARALYKDAGLVILDEPFNELDAVSETALLQHFRRQAASGKIVVLITHNKTGLSYCNKIFSLDETVNSYPI